MRTAKFEVLVDNIIEALGDETYRSGWMTFLNDIIPALALIYDYDKLNDYGKIIMKKNDMGICNEKKEICRYQLYDCVEIPVFDIKIKLAAVKIFASNRSDEEAYHFLFWAMMILAVDDTDKEEHLLLICDFARILKISDEDVKFILNIIRMIFQKDGAPHIVITGGSLQIFQRVVEMYE